MPCCSAITVSAINGTNISVIAARTAQPWRVYEADVAGAIRWLRRTGLDEVRRAVLAAEQAQFAAAGDELERWRGREKLTEEAKAALYLLHERSAHAAEALLGKLVADATATAR